MIIRVIEHAHSNALSQTLIGFAHAAPHIH